MNIDLRSDTVTQPSKGMMDAILNAKVGDDVFKEDPSVNALEEKLATLFGMEEALFFPTGSMANQAAIKLHTQPGEELICDKWAHIYNYEAGGAAFNSGVTCKLIDGTRGMIKASQVEEAINPANFYHSPLTTLVCLENTTNKGGGACYNWDDINEIKEVCNNNNLNFHLDGARLFNALVAKNDDPKNFGRTFDSISICLSKGLGIPLGSVLLGSKEYMKKAIRIRKIFGGGMRQVGFMAAAGIYALDNNVERLKDDHDKAQELSEVLKTLGKVTNVEPVETNIVIFSVVDETSLLTVLDKENIRISSMGQGKLRIVTHLDYTQAMHEKVLGVFKKHL